MQLTPEVIADLDDEYCQQEPLYTVEREQIETLPDALAAGEYGWRDVVWVVRWYYRRFLGTYPDTERRSREEQFAANDFEAIRTTLAEVVDAEALERRVELLTALDGVDVPVASAFLSFLEPDRYVVVGPRTWAALRAAGELADPYPSPPSTAEYAAYLDACRAIAERAGVDLWTLYRALWRHEKE